MTDSEQPAGGTHPCPACDATVSVASVLDDGACPACSTARTVIYALADGIVSLEDCEPAYEGADRLVISDSATRDQRDRIRDLPDPADEDEREVVYA